MYRQLLLVSVFAVLPFSVAAQETPAKKWYFGVAVGSTQFDPPANNTLSEAQTAGSNPLTDALGNPLPGGTIDPLTPILPPVTGPDSPLPTNPLPTTPLPTIPLPTDPLIDTGSASSFEGNSFDIDGSNALARVVVGRQLWSFLSIEAGYGSLGKYEADFETGSAKTGKAKASVKAGFLGFQANTSRERKWGLFGKAGIAKWKVSGDLEEDGTDPYAGIGVFRMTSDSGRINLGVERFVIDSESVDAVTIEFIAQY